MPQTRDISPTSGPWRFRRDLWQQVLMAAVLVLHLVFLISALKNDRFLIDDSVQYLTLAENMDEEGVFSQSYSAPFVPDVQRVPGYPLFLTALGRSIPLILIVQHLLVLFTGLMIYRTLKELVAEKYARIGAWGYLLQPYPVIFASMVLSETLFTVVLVASLGHYLRYWKGGKLRDVMIALVWMGAAAYVRPLGWPLLLVMAGLTIGRVVWMRKMVPQSMSVKVGLACILLPMLLAGPWMLRNQSVTGRMTFNSMGDMGMLHGRLGGLAAFREGKGVGEHELYMAGDSLAATDLGLKDLRQYYSAKQNHETELYAPGVGGVTVGYFLKYPASGIAFQAKSVWAMLTGVGYGWAGFVTESKGMAIATAGIQVHFNALMFFGFLIAIWRFRRWKGWMWVLAGAIALLFVMSAAAWADGRYRVVIDPLLLMGLMWLLDDRKTELSNRT
ncbi:MAG: hypothetical protein AAF570_15760 [Bacteroidota bacterium]